MGTRAFVRPLRLFVWTRVLGGSGFCFGLVPSSTLSSQAQSLAGTAFSTWDGSCSVSTWWGSPFRGGDLESSFPQRRPQKQASYLQSHLHAPAWHWKAKGSSRPQWKRSALWPTGRFTGAQACARGVERLTVLSCSPLPLLGEGPTEN